MQVDGNNSSNDVVYLIFRLDVADGWPPVAAEGIPCLHEAGSYRIRVPPLFLKGLSVGDVIAVFDDDQGQVCSWRHLSKSDRSTVRVMTFGAVSIDVQLSNLRGLGVNVEGFSGTGLFALDIPASVPAPVLDECFGEFSKAELAIAYPSWRHENSDAGSRIE